MYSILNFIVLAFVYVFVFVVNPKFLTKRWLLAASIMLLLTVVFDSLIIHYQVVAYDVAKISGLRLGKAPVEDFAYIIAAMLLVPMLWNWFKRKNDDGNK